MASRGARYLIRVRRRNLGEWGRLLRTEVLHDSPRDGVEDENELIAAEQDIVMARELKQLADATPDGHVLAVTEMVDLEQGRRSVDDRIALPHPCVRVRVWACVSHRGFCLT